MPPIFTVGWICALPDELAAARVVMDERYEPVPSSPTDTNVYRFGRIGVHDVVAACLPAGQIGTNSAAVVASHMRNSFPSLRFALLVGIGGGVPSDEHDIRLGDVVISQPAARHGGVVQFDFGKTVSGGEFTRTGSLNAPPTILLNALANLRTDISLDGVHTTEHLSAFANHRKFNFPGSSQDVLYSATSEHVPGPTCASCRKEDIIVRQARHQPDPVLFFGTIASVNRVMKDGSTRDRISQDLGGVLCFEMEAAGLMNNFECLVIRGICDYADSHKNKQWQPYAAATAAACAKELLLLVPQVVSATGNKVLSTSSLLSVEDRECLRSLAFPEQESRGQAIHFAESTCQWLLKNNQYQEWTKKDRGLFWVKGSPGTGKSSLMKFAATTMRHKQPGDLVLSYFIHGRGTELQRSLSGVFRALLSTMLASFPQYLSQLTRMFEDREARFGSYQEMRWSWSALELQDYMFKTLSQGTKDKSVIIFIDALDECGELDAKDLLRYFRDLMQQIEMGRGKVKICFSSRHYPILGADTIPTVHVEERNGMDMRLVVHERLAQIDPGERRQQIEQIEKHILRKSQGGFQWAVLVTDKILEGEMTGMKETNLLKMLTSIPETLDGLYGDILSSSNGAQKEQMVKLFQWILFARRPLSSQELREALATDKDTASATIDSLRRHDSWVGDLSQFEKYVKSLSRGLVEFQDRDIWSQYEADAEPWNREAQFIHQSVADYLVEKFLPYQDDRSTARSVVGDGHFEISRSCFKYITMNDVQGGAGLSRGSLSVRFPLAPYAVQSLFYHVHKVEQEGLPQLDLLSLIQWDLRPRALQQIAHLWRVLDPDYGHAPGGWPFIGATPLHVLIAFGSGSALDAVLQEENPEINETDANGNTPLLLAIREGYPNIALMLLDRSSEWIHRHIRAIHESTNQGDQNIDQEGTICVNVNAMNDEGDSPLSVAVTMPRAGELILRLIKAGADVKHPHQKAEIFVYAIRNRDSALFTYLIKEYDSPGGAVYFVYREIFSGNKDHILELFLSELLKAGANTRRSRVFDWFYETNNTDGHHSDDDYFDDGEENSDDDGDEDEEVILLASRKGQTSTTRLLLSHDISVNCSNSNGESPLHVAVSRGHIEIVKLLLEKGANLNAVDNYGNTPLVLAVCGGVIEIVELLLETGADLTAPNGDAAPILRAVLNREKAIFMHLIRQDINLDETINIISRRLSYEDKTVLEEFLSSSSVSDANAHCHALSDMPTLVDASNSQKNSGETEQIHQIEADQVGSETTLNNSEIGPIISNMINPGNGDDEDIKTVYSVATQSEDDDNFVSTLAEDLFSYIREVIHGTTISMGELEDEQTWNQVLASLPGLLQDFALSTGHQAGPQIARDVMVFTHKYRTHITQKLRALYTSDIHSPPSEISVNLDSDEVRDRDSNIYSWLNGHPGATKLESSVDETGEDTGISLDEFDAPHESNMDDEDLGTYGKSLDEFDESHKSDVYDEDLGSDETKVSARVDVYRDYFHSLDAYQWLRSRLHHNFLTTPADTDFFTGIRQKIMKELPKPQIVSRRTSPVSHEVTFRVDWNPHAFLNQQGYLGELGDAMANTLTLTGTTSDAQAMSCAEYLCKTWPLTGKVLLEVIMKIARAEAAIEHTAELFDHTKISAQIEAYQIVLVATGTKSSLAELGQQLAWLGSALRVEREQTEEPAYSYCDLLLDRLVVEHDNANGQVASRSDWKIRFETKRQDREAALSNGQCWTSLIRNHVLVQGYPILRRAERGTGLEVALGVISWLLQAPYATVFDSRPFIKGPRAMLVLARNANNALIWHLHESHGESRITYNDAQIPIRSSKDIGMFDVEDLLKSRHFVGWCSKSRSVVGSSGAEYNIQLATRKPVSDCPYYMRGIQPGVHISNSHALSYPRNWNAINAPVQRQPGYATGLKDLTKESVALFDSDEKRSWLVDGVSALLHLVRASLDSESRGALHGSRYHFEMEEYSGPEPFSSDNASFRTLNNEANWEKSLFKTSDRDVPETFKQRVEKIWSFLEMAIDTENFFNRNGHKCPALEGYEFREIAAVKPKAVYRRSFKLPPEGGASIILCRELSAVTLVGNGFGELIEPEFTSTDFCSLWRVVPQGKGYVCVQASHLAYVMDERMSEHHRLRGYIETLLQDTSRINTAESCVHNEGDTCNHAQTLRMSEPFDGLGDDEIGVAGSFVHCDGAVIFGHCSYPLAGILETESSNSYNSVGLDTVSDTAIVQGSSLATSITSRQYAIRSKPIQRLTQGSLGNTTAVDPSSSNRIPVAHDEINQLTDQLQNGSDQRTALIRNHETNSMDLVLYGAIVLGCFMIESFYWTTFSLSLMLFILLYNKWKPARAWVRFIKHLCVAALLVWLIVLSPLHVLFPTLLDLWTPYQATFDSSPYEIIYDRGDLSSGNISVDVFAIHGLGSNASRAWVSRDGSNIHWLRDILPSEPDLKSIRVILLNHQTSWASHSPMMTFHDHARSMLHHISDVNKGEHPIIFVAHSFGGLLLKQALLYAQSRRNNIALRTKGILFLGVPHYGASNTVIARLLACTAYWRGSSDALLKLLSTQKRDLQELDTVFRESFARSSRHDKTIRPHIANFLEMRPERLGAFSLKETVSREYGELGYADNIPLNTDHRGLNKFRSSDDANYRTFLSQFLAAFEHATEGPSKLRSPYLDLFWNTIHFMSLGYIGATGHTTDHH